MSAHWKVTSQAVSVALLVAILSFPPATAQTESSDHQAVITWVADLQGKNEVPAVATQAVAQAEFEFDFRKQEATVKISGTNLRDVSKIQLGVEQVRGELKGPAKVILYDAAKDASLPAVSATKEGGPVLLYTRTFSGSTFKDLSDVVLNGQGVVEVLTKTHPGGELIGQVQMRKSYR